MLRVLTLLLAATVVGCAEDRPARDLVAEFPSADLGVESRLIDFGTPAARRHLLAGFGPDEHGVVWSVGMESLLEFHLAAPRDVPLTLRCAPFEFANAPAQSVTLVLNGRPGPRVALGVGLADYEVVLPRTATRSGWNRLALRYAWARTPAEISLAPDRRPRAVAWDAILLHGVAPGPTVTPLVDEHGLLTIPAGTSVSYYLPASHGARLTADRIDVPAGASLSIRTAADGGDGALLAEVRSSLLQRGEIPLRGDRPVRLSFAAEGGTIRVAGAAWRPPGESGPRWAERRPARPNILVYLIDTLRADRLGCYGQERRTSPHIDVLAREAFRFTNVVAESSWTRPTVASLFTGVAPPRHGVYGRGNALREGTVTMATLLRDAGYETAGFVTNGNVAPVFGFAQGFDVYELIPGTMIPGPDGIVTEPLPSSDHLTARARRWLGSRDRRKPFFLYLHAADPHSPYVPPVRFRRRFGVSDEEARVGLLESLRALHAAMLPDGTTSAKLLALYDAEIAHNDHHFGKLMAHLARRGLYDDTLIVLVADHGEEFGEHGGWEHGQSLYREVVHIPLLMKLPGRHAGRPLHVPAQLADVLPTLLAQLGLDRPPGLDGVDLLVGLDGVAPASTRATFAHLALDGQVADAIQYGPWKLVLGSRGSELFDHRQDAREHVSVLAEHLETAGYLRGRLEGRRAARAGSPQPAAAPSQDVLRNLRALGYVE